MQGLQTPHDLTLMATDGLAARLMQRRQQLSPICQLSRQRISCWTETLLGVLFPHLDGKCTPADKIPLRLADLEDELARILVSFQASQQVAAAFFEQDLPLVDEYLQEDALSIYQGDPAAQCTDEVILAYPGFLAVAIYRLAHALQQRGIVVIPRMMTEYAHQLTGIDIHPGAQIGRRFCIDHGTGVVIGESSVIGDDVKLYQGVTLGALSVSKDLADTRRHPTIEDRVVIYAGATILGGQTVIGHDSIIGGNVWLTRSVAPFSRVYHRPTVDVRSDAERDFPLEFHI